MKKVMAALLPLLLLAGCSSRQEEYQRKRAVELAGLKASIDAAEKRLADTWATVPPEVKKNKVVERKYNAGKWRSELAIRYLAEGQLQVVHSEIWLITHYTEYLERATKSPTRWSELNAKLTSTEESARKLCPKNARAFSHLAEARIDLDTAKANGFSPELCDAASREIAAVKALVENPFECKLDHGQLVDLRDRFAKLKVGKLTPRQAAHIEAAGKCLDGYRSTLLLRDQDESLLDMTAEHLKRATSNSCSKSEEQEHNESREHYYVRLLDRVLDTRDFIAENCPDNKEATQIIENAYQKYQRVREAMIKDWFPSGWKEVRELVESARKSVATHPRIGAR